MAARILSLINDGATPKTPISAYCPSPSAPFRHVTNEDILLAVRTAIPHIPNDVKGYSEKLVGSHSLWAGGAMALFQQGCEIAKIMKMGCWTSTAFMSYIHKQLDTVSKGAAQQMSQASTFVNLDINPPPNTVDHETDCPNTQNTHTSARGHPSPA